MNEIYHSGEKKVQQLTGELAAAESNGRMISDILPMRAIHFIERQPMVIVSSFRELGEIWTSLLVGDVGFIRAAHVFELHIDMDLIRSSSKDRFFETINTSSNFGFLFIEFTTRRRYRINGACSLENNIIKVHIQQAYGNCPQYIQRRELRFPKRIEETQGTQLEGYTLVEGLIKIIQSADTLFVGSRSEAGNMDASHRGGKPGFVKVLSDGRLKIPDYRGNSMYNTLGNFIQNPSAGLLFIDFKKGETLQLAGDVELLFDQSSEDDMLQTTGTGRYWIFTTQKWIYTEEQHHVRWNFLEAYPYNP